MWILLVLYGSSILFSGYRQTYLPTNSILILFFPIFYHFWHCSTVHLCVILCIHVQIFMESKLLIELHIQSSSIATLPSKNLHYFILWIVILEIPVTFHLICESMLGQVLVSMWLNCIPISWMGCRHTAGGAPFSSSEGGISPPTCSEDFFFWCHMASKGCPQLCLHH